MNVLVVEDEGLTAQRLISMLKKYDASIHVVGQLSSITGAIAWFDANGIASVDLIFMDIHLEDGDSFQIISQLNLTTPIIFTTAFDDYMIKAFKVNSIDYLLKPVNYEELSTALNKFRSLRASQRLPALDMNVVMKTLREQMAPQFKDRFMITVGTKIRSIKTEDVAYFYLEEKAVLLVTNEGTNLPIDYSLDRLVQCIDPKQFFRISRQFIVSLNSIQMVRTISPGRLTLDLHPKTKHHVAVSGDRISDFKKWLGKD